MLKILNAIRQIDKTYIGDGVFLDFTCKFNEPSTPNKIKQFEKKTNLILPEDYKQFLLISDGIMFYNEADYEIFGLEAIEMIYDTNTYKEGFYIIASIMGEYIGVNSVEVYNGSYLYYGSNIMPHFTPFNHDFKTFLDRLVCCQIQKYWEWFENKNTINFFK